MSDARRLELHGILSNICQHVYFQPPENLKIEYPCIIYRRANGLTMFADNGPYRFYTRYTITVIDKDPDSEMIPKIAALPMCTLDRHYTFENLNHDVFNIVY